MLAYIFLTDLHCHHWLQGVAFQRESVRVLRGHFRSKKCFRVGELQAPAGMPKLVWELKLKRWVHYAELKDNIVEVLLKGDVPNFGQGKAKGKGSLGNSGRGEYLTIYKNVKGQTWYYDWWVKSLEPWQVVVIGPNIYGVDTDGFDYSVDTFYQYQDIAQDVPTPCLE